MQARKKAVDYENQSKKQSENFQFLGEGELTF
jgi:hypothetical protein